MFRNFVKEYLNEPGKNLDTLKEELGISYRIFHAKNGDLVILSYSQIDSPKTNPIVRMCRGLVLEMNTWDIISYPFYRFYNFEEVPEERLKFNWKNAMATEKIDGCCDENTIIITKNNGNKTIREICEDKSFNDEILAFDHNSDEKVWTKVKNKSIQRNVNKQWYEIEFDKPINVNGKISTSIKLTGNHRIFCKNLNCYRRVDELNGTEELDEIDIDY